MNYGCIIHSTLTLRLLEIKLIMLKDILERKVNFMVYRMVLIVHYQISLLSRVKVADCFK